MGSWDFLSSSNFWPVTKMTRRTCTGNIYTYNKYAFAWCLSSQHHTYLFTLGAKLYKGQLRSAGSNLELINIYK